MNARTLGVAWVLVAVLVAGGLLWTLSAWRSVSTRAAQATVERTRLTAEIRQREEEIVAEMRGHGGLLQELQWSAAGADPRVFLNRLGELAEGSRLRITAIGPLERSSTAQFSKLWHTVQVTGPYRDIRELAARVEREQGVLEDLAVEASAAGPAGGSDDLLAARFKMTALELSPDGRKVLDRALAAAGAVGAGGAPGLSLPLPSAADGAADLRDPFLFGPGVVAARALAPAPPGPIPGPVAAAMEPREAPAPPSTPAEIPMELRGIVEFPGGSLAILNNQIVRAGDSVAGHRVERVTDREVVLRPPEGGTRVVPLPTVGTPGGAGGPGRARNATAVGGGAPAATGPATPLPRR